MSSRTPPTARPSSRFLAALLLAALSGACDVQVEPARPRARSVVVYLVDTLRADHLGCYGYERDTSPRLDAFAREGLRFETCLAQSTWTKPATASVLTGLYPSQHGLQLTQATLGAHVQTITEMLPDGIRTGAFITNHWIFRRNSGLLRSCETYRTFRSTDEHLDYARAEEAVDAALAWIETLGDEPYFCYVHTLDPHAPYAPAETFDRFGDPTSSAIDGSFGLHSSAEKLSELDAADRQRLIDLYDGEIAYSDHQFGRFLDGLAALGRDADTLVIFTADHGEEFEEHGSWRHNPFMHPEVVGVPLIMRFPGGPDAPRGTRQDLTGQVDIVPTVLAELGLAPLPGLPGRDLRLDPGPRQAPPRISEVEGSVSIQAVQTPEHKYVRQWSPGSRETLFDLSLDPGESEDVALQRTTERDALRTLLDSYISSTSAGYSLMVQNGSDDWIVVDCRLTATRPLERVELFYVEDKAHEGETRDGPARLSFGEDRRFHANVRFHIKPDDGDGVFFMPHSDVEQVRVEVLVDGEAARPEFVRLGPQQTSPATVPFDLVLVSGRELAAPRFSAREHGLSTPYQVRLWANRSAASPTTEMSEEDAAALRALGYAGD